MKDIRELREKLSAYGKVIECSENINNTFSVNITSDFNNGAISTFKCIEIINDFVGDKYPIVQSCNVDAGNFKYILKA